MKLPLEYAHCAFCVHILRTLRCVHILRCVFCVLLILRVVLVTLCVCKFAQKEKTKRPERKNSLSMPEGYKVKHLINFQYLFVRQIYLTFLCISTRS